MTRMPVVFVPHGGGPWPFVDLPLGSKEELAALSTYLRSLAKLPKPKALLVVSAHWEERLPTVTTSEAPPMLYDYSGFPKAAYEVTWPAPGNPKLAARVRELLRGAGFETAEDPKRGYDHGTFVPMKVAFPKADIPVVQLSLKLGLDPREHLAIGRALQPLRDEGVLIVGSGMTFHNMRGFGPQGRTPSQEFDEWLQKSATLPDETARANALADWTKAPSARAAHPREEHLLPLMVVAGAAGKDPGRVAYAGPVMDVAVSAYHYGESV